MQNFLRLFFVCMIFHSHLLHGQLIAILKYAYYSSTYNYLKVAQEVQTNGIVSSQGSQSIVRNAQAFTLMDFNGQYDACHPSSNTKIYSNGIAIIHRGGGCTFSMKIAQATEYGAIAVIIYDPRNNGQETFDMLHNNSEILAVYVQRTMGVYLFALANDNQTHLNITIEPINGDYVNMGRGNVWYKSRGAILFVVVSICVLVFLCLSWFVFYYCRRYRLRTSKDRLQNRLVHAAKKALTKIPLVTITQAPRIEESCVICLDAIKIGDTVRQLACDHRFHQHCVDPWLINHRHCPLCNLDILAAYRVSIPGTTPRRSRFEAPVHLVPTYPNSLATTAATSIVPNDQSPQMIIPMPIPTISGALKTERYGEQNPSFHADDEQH